MADRHPDPGHHPALAVLPLIAAPEHRFGRVRPGGVRDRIAREVPGEMPIAFEIGGLGYAVMMATPDDLVDFAAGFCLAERLIETASELLDAEPHQTDSGILLRVTIAPERQPRVLDRVRHRVSESSCGLCGIDSLEQALRPLPPLPANVAIEPAAIFIALAGLRAHQPLNRATGGAHAAALCASDGSIRLVREDVGRHNALDKLIGAMARERIGWDGGFALLSARCSFELVEKAVLARCPTLVTISVATDLAITRAAAAGLRLIVLARADAYLEAPGRSS